MLVSVIICTYNRSELLLSTIHSLLNQSFPHDQYEIIIVDNNSTDGTRKIVDEIMLTSCVTVRYIFEAQQGLSFARNRGICEAKGDFVVFVDDDIEAELLWLENIIDSFSDDQIVAAGGPLRPLWLSSRPEWLTDSWLDYLSVSEFEKASSTGFFSDPDAPWGANMAFRRSVFVEVGYFATSLGRQETNLLSGEEYELFCRIYANGFKIAFAKGAVVKHKILPVRLQKNWFYRRSFWQGYTNALIDSCFDKRNMELNKALNALIDSENSYKLEFDCKMANRYLKGYVYKSYLLGKLNLLYIDNTWRSILDRLLLRVIKKKTIDANPKAKSYRTFISLLGKLQRAHIEQ